MKPLNLRDYEALAREVMHPAAWAYLAAGSDDETTHRENSAAFGRIRLLPRMLRGVGPAALRTEVLGTPVEAPIFVAPMGIQRLANEEGECATASAAGSVGTLMVVSTVSSRSLEEISASAEDRCGSSSTSTARGRSPSASCVGPRPPVTGRSC